jgi:hypothetical protein
MGQVVIFDQSLLHKANIAETTKYTMRTDILIIPRKLLCHDCGEGINLSIILF